MQLLSRMNKKMDLGYKITTFSCSYCSGVTLAKINSQNKQGYVYCPKCDKQYIPVKNQYEEQQGQGQEQDQYEEYYNQIKEQNCMQDRNNITKQQNNNNLTPLKSQQSQPPQTISNNKPNTYNQNNAHNKESNQLQQQQDQIQSQYNHFLALYNSQIKTPQQLKSQQTSKKIGQKLINGWAMLEQACQQCNVPLMKSKKGELICCGCDKDYAKINSKNNKNNKMVENKMEESKNMKNGSNDNKEVVKHKYKQEIQSKDINKVIKQNTQQKYNKVQNNLQKIQNNQKQPNKQQQRIQSKSDQKHQINYNSQNKGLAHEKINNICLKTLDYLESRLEQAFSMNDLDSVEKVLRTIKATKQLL